MRRLWRATRNSWSGLKVAAQSEAAFRGYQEYFVWDAGVGVVERGRWNVKECVDQQPWLPDGPVSTDVSLVASEENHGYLPLSSEWLPAGDREPFARQLLVQLRWPGGKVHCPRCVPVRTENL